MRTLIVLCFAALLAGCATPVSKPTATLAPPPPPLPAPAEVMKRQSLRAFSAPTVALPTVDNSSSTNYGTVRHFAVTNELGAKSLGVRIEFPNWPTNTPYSIQASTNLVNWTGIILSRGDAGATVEVIDQEHTEFYRIVRAWFSQ